MRKFIRLALLSITTIFAAAICASGEAQASASSSADLTTQAGICYQAHVQNVGWQGWECNGDIAGTVGQSLRLEALRIRASGAGHFCASAHVQDIGWMNQRCAASGQTVTVGTTGRSLRMEALSMSVGAGSICGNAHVQNVGWQGYRCGRVITIGTTGQSLRMEAVSIYLS